MTRKILSFFLIFNLVFVLLISASVIDTQVSGEKSAIAGEAWRELSGFGPAYSPGDPFYQ